MICNKCGSQCLDDAKFCNVCGNDLEAQRAYAQPAPAYDATVEAAPQDPGKTFAIVSLVCGIVSFVCGCCAPIPNILAIVFGLVAKNKGSKSPMATVGIILGAAAIVVSIIGWILYFSTGIFAGILEANYHY